MKVNKNHVDFQGADLVSACFFFFLRLIVRSLLKLNNLKQQNLFLALSQKKFGTPPQTIYASDMLHCAIMTE